MIIHVVKEGETIEEIAEAYGVTSSQLIRENVITNPNALLPGQDIVIQYTSITYAVQPGDTLYSIASLYGVTVISLLQNNPHIITTPTLYPGQTIVIAYNNERIGSMSVVGYAYPYIDRTTLLKTLPYLTYLTLFTYGFKPDGSLIEIDDEELIQLARDYGVAPLMLISTLDETGVFSNVLAHKLFTDEALQDTLITNIINTMEQKEYYGVDVDFEFVFPEDREAFIRFVTNLRIRCNEKGFPVFIALAPKTSATQTGSLYEAHDYEAMGKAANTVLLMTYEWGYTYGPPMAVAPINKVREVLNYGVTAIDPAKILMGIPNYGYDWPLPFVKGTTKARTLGNVEALDQAINYNVPIQFDTTAMAPFYRYKDLEIEHEVWFENARSIEAKIRLIPEYKLLGASWWNIMKYFPQNWLVVNALMNINKVLKM